MVATAKQLVLEGTRGPHEITHQYIATYHSKHRCCCFLLPGNV